MTLNQKHFRASQCIVRTLYCTNEIIVQQSSNPPKPKAGFVRVVKPERERESLPLLPYTIAQYSSKKRIDPDHLKLKTVAPVE